MDTSQDHYRRLIARNWPNRLLNSLISYTNMYAIVRIVQSRAMRAFFRGKDEKAILQK